MGAREAVAAGAHRPVAPAHGLPAHDAAWRTTGSRWPEVERLVAVAACVVVAARVPLQQALTAGIVVGLALLPVWVGVLRRYRLAPALMLLGGAALASGAVLTALARPTHAVSGSLLQINSLVLVSVLAGIGVLLWAREVLGWRGAALAYAAGLVLGIPLGGSGGDNPWKYALSVPVTVLVLALCARTRSRALELLALAGLAAVSAVSDSRSAASVLLLAATLVLWQVVQRAVAARSTPARAFATIVGAAAVAYATLQAFLLDGVFGRSAMERTQAQVASGSLLTGGRPELGASVALLTRRPTGYGAGTTPTVADVVAAKSGMEQLRYDADNGYVEHYLFGNGYEVHSVVGDLWIRFGLAGAALAALLLVGLLMGVTRRIADSRASALLLYTAIQVLWDLFFSPLFATSISTLVLAVALALPRREPAGVT